MKRLALLLSLCVPCAAFGGAWTNLWSTPEQQAQRLLESGHAAEAAQRFRDPRRRAFAELKAHRFPDAARRLEPFKDVDSQYNRGNALARAGDLHGALAAYDSALSQQPDNRDVRRNRDLVAQALQQQRSQQHKSAGKSGQQDGAKHAGTGASHGAGPRNGQSSARQPSGAGSAGSQSSVAQQGAEASSARSAGAHPSSAGSASAQSRSVAEANADAAGARAQTPGSSGDDAEQARRDATAAADLQQKQALAAAARKGATGNERAAGDDTTLRPATPNTRASPPAKPVTEESLALDQWLRRIPDDSGGLLRRKFLIEHLMKQRGTDQ